MADPSTSSSMWAFMLSWLTPSSLFLFLNLTIATIVLSHRFNRKPQHDQLSLFDSPQLVPTPSFLERVRSINFSHYNFQPGDSEPQQYPTPDNPTGLVRTPSFLERVRSINFSHYNFQPVHSEPQQYPTPDNPTGLVRTPSFLERVRSINFSHYNFQPVHSEPQQYPTPDNPTGLVRTPSFLERLGSINFSHYNFQQPDPEPQQYPTPDNPTGLVRTPSFLERVRSISFPHYNFQQPDPEPQQVTQYPTPDNSTGLVRTPSLLARLKSMDFSSLYRPDQPDQESEDLHPTGSHDPNPRHEHVVHRSKSDTGCGASLNRPEKVMKKSTSEKSALGGFEDEDEGVDAKADDFINRFKQQLKLQRLDSLLRYREMLKRN